VHGFLHIVKFLDSKVVEGGFTLHCSYLQPKPNANKHSNPRPSSRNRAVRSARSQQQSNSILQSGARITYANLVSSVLPRLWRGTLRYAETFSFTTGAAGVMGTSQLMSLNSLFDPNITGVGHQPYGFDQLSTWYKRYLVLRARITLVATTPGSAADITVAWKLDNPDNFLSMAGQSVDRITEAPMIGTGLVTSSGNSRVFTVNIETLPWQVLGITRAQYLQQQNTYGALISASPSLQPTFEVAAGSLSGAAAEAVVIQIVISYDAEFSEPGQMAQS
jgi:hypothetical protein